MSDWFTDEEMERIVRFAQSSGYDREPAMLLPDEANSPEEDVTGGGAGDGGSTAGRPTRNLGDRGETPVSEE